MQKQEKNISPVKNTKNQIQKKTKSKSKFVNLNFNLKHEIIDFLPLEQQFNQTTQLNKRFHFSLNKKRIFLLLKREAGNLMKKLSFTVEKINAAKEFLLSALNCREFSEDVAACEGSAEKVEQILNFLFKLKHKNSTQLDLTETKSLDICVLSSFLAENETLQHLFLFENKLGVKPEDLKFVCLGLIDNCSVKNLYVSQNKIGKNATDLVFVNFLLLLNQNITFVDFSYNRIGKNCDDVRHLANALKHNKSLKSLNLSANLIGATNKDDFLLLCAALAENNTLEYFDLAFNLVENSEENAVALLMLMQLNTSLKFFSLLMNPLGKNEKLLKYKESELDTRIMI